jgi:hypothetical protein
MEDTVVNRFTLLLLIGTSVAGSNAFGQSQGRTGNPAVRVAQSPVVPARSSSVPRPSRPIGKLVSQQNVIEDAGEVIYDDAQESVVLGESYDPNEGLAEIGGGCATCGDTCGGTCGSNMGFDLCNPAGLDGRQLCLGLPSHGWVSVEYLSWYPVGMNAPALVTTSTPATTPQNQAGVLGIGTTSTLYGGDNNILDDRMSGTRVRFGWWFANNPNLGIEGEYFGFGTKTESFDQQSNGTTILARPFFNAITGLEDSELVSYPGVVSGRVRSTATSKLDGSAVRFRRLLCCSSGCGFSLLRGPVPSQSRIDATLGWRFLQLKETMGIQEDLTSLTANQGSFVINDNFRTRNQFNGAEIGVHWMGRRGYWSLDTLMRLGLGNTRQEVGINGTTLITQNGVTTNNNGGLLAQRTNSGTFVRNQFGVVPELGATLGYQWTPRLRLTAGYSFIYWSNVVRPGDQIDTTVNPNLLPPENPTQTAFLNPRFAFQDSDYWVQGLSLGGEYRW